MQPTFPSNSGSQRDKRPFGDPQVEQKSAFLSTGARGAGLGNRVWRKGCSAPTLEPPVYYWEVLSRVQYQGSGLCRKQGRASRAGPSAAGVLKANAPVTPAPGAASLIQTLVGHHTRLGEVAPARGRKWPAAGPGCPQVGSPGHTRPPAWIAHPSPAFALCLALCRSPHPMRGASSRVPPERTQVPGRPVPPDHSPGRATGAQPPARSLGLPATGGGGGTGVPACSSRLGPGLSGSTRLVQPGSYFCFGSGRAT